MNLPQIETTRLQLRRYTLEDLENLYQLWTDPKVRKYLWDNKVISKKRALSEIKKSVASFETDGFGEWAVFSKGARTLIGFCGFRFVSLTSEIELIFGMTPQYWGLGFATEAARAVIRFGFEELRFDSISASANAPNVASVRVLEKCGMKFERCLRKGDLDLLCYAISQEAYRSNQSLYRPQRQ